MACAGTERRAARASVMRRFGAADDRTDQREFKFPSAHTQILWCLWCNGGLIRHFKTAFYPLSNTGLHVDLRGVTY